MKALENSTVETKKIEEGGYCNQKPTVSVGCDKTSTIHDLRTFEENVMSLSDSIEDNAMSEEVVISHEMVDNDDDGTLVTMCRQFTGNLTIAADANMGSQEATELNSNKNRNNEAVDVNCNKICNVIRTDTFEEQINMSSDISVATNDVSQGESLKYTFDDTLSCTDSCIKSDVFVSESISNFGGVDMSSKQTLEKQIGLNEYKDTLQSSNECESTMSCNEFDNSPEQTLEEHITPIVDNDMLVSNPDVSKSTPNCNELDLSINETSGKHVGVSADTGMSQNSPCVSELTTLICNEMDRSSKQASKTQISLYEDEGMLQKNQCVCESTSTCYDLSSNVYGQININTDDSLSNEGCSSVLDTSPSLDHLSKMNEPMRKESCSSTDSEPFMFPCDNFDSSGYNTNARTRPASVGQSGEDDVPTRLFENHVEDLHLSCSFDSAQQRSLEKGCKLLKTRPRRSSLKLSGSSEDCKKFVHFPPDIRHIRKIYKYDSFDDTILLHGLADDENKQ